MGLPECVWEIQRAFNWGILRVTDAGKILVAARVQPHNYFVISSAGNFFGSL